MLRSIFLGLVLTKVVALNAQNSRLLDSLIQSIDIFQTEIADNPAPFEIQVIYKPLSGSDSGSIHRWNVDSTRYFYPASTVKLPAAILTLQWINDQQIKGLSPNSFAFFGFESLEQQLNEARTDTSTSQPLWQPSLANFIHDAMVVSDNEAYNKLFDFLGPFYLNDELWRRGWKTRIIHRVGQSAYPYQFNNQLPPITIREFISGNSEQVFSRNSAVAKTPYSLTLRNEKKGLGRYDDEAKVVIPGPFDFSEKNFLALEDLAEILQAVVAPETIDSSKRFRIPEAWRKMLLSDLSTRPADSRNPLHHDKPDGYVNFLYYGGKGDWEENGPQIYNKVGDAYGYLTEAAIFEDPAKSTRYLLAATIHVNSNQLYNDGVYEYETIGFPFMNALGRAMWEYAKAR